MNGAFCIGRRLAIVASQSENRMRSHDVDYCAFFFSRNSHDDPSPRGSAPEVACQPIPKGNAVTRHEDVSGLDPAKHLPSPNVFSLYGREGTPPLRAALARLWRDRVRNNSEHVVTVAGLVGAMGDARAVDA
jgi:hypothetical protein